jgi:sulfur-oxidizing protein SoxX
MPPGAGAAAADRRAGRCGRLEGGHVRAVVAAVVLGLAHGTPAGAAEPAPVVPLVIVGDGIPQPLTAVPGDARRGQAIVGNRQVGLCLLCHAAPVALFPHEPVPGTVSTDLAGAGRRWSAPQLRLRVADARALNPATVMPSFHRLPQAPRVAAAFQGRPLLDAQQVEDVVAFLQTLR